MPRNLEKKLVARQAMMVLDRLYHIFQSGPSEELFEPLQLNW